MQCNDFPLLIAGGGIGFEPFRLLCAQCIILIQIVGVEHHKVRVVIVKRIIDTGGCILFGHIGKQEIVDRRVGTVRFMVTRRRHQNRIQQIVGSRIQCPVPLLKVFAAVHKVACMHNKCGIGIERKRRIHHICPGFILPFNAALAVAHMEEGKAVRIVGGFKYTDLAPPPT